MAVLDPEWTESLDTANSPRDPLGSTRARNQVVDVYAHGLITENPFRMRYISLFPWFLRALNEGHVDGEEYSEDFLIKRFEKVVALSSRYHSLVEDQSTEALRAISGVLELRRLTLEKLKKINLDGFELQQNDGYGFQNYERALQKFLLKRGGYQLTGAGEEVAESVTPALEPVADSIFDCVLSGEVVGDDFEEFARRLAIQSLHLYPEEFEAELRALQRVLCGLINWQGDPVEGTTTLIDGPDHLETEFLHYLYASLPADEDQVKHGKGSPEEGKDVDSDPLRSITFENFSEHLHDYRRSTVLFFLQAWKLYQSDSEKSELTDTEIQSFQDTKNLFLLYWLQIYAGYAIEAQLEALTTFVNKFDPPRYALEEILELPPADTVMANAEAALTALSISPADESVSPQSFTRHLLLYDEALNRALNVETETSEASVTNLRELQSLAAGQSEPPHGLEQVNEVTIGKSVRSALNQLNDATPEESAEPWGRALGRSIALLSYVDARVIRLQSTNPQLYRLMDYQISTRPGNSLPWVHRYLQSMNPETRLQNLGQRLVENRVVRVHEDVMYSRLTPGNLQRLFSLDRDESVCLRVTEDPHTRPYRARPRFIRFDELCTLIRDCNLLTGSQSDGYTLTETGERFLSKAHASHGTPGGGGE